MKYHILNRRKKSSFRKGETALNVILHNCTNSRRFSQCLYEDSILFSILKIENTLKIKMYNGNVFIEISVFKHASQTFQGEALKNSYKKILFIVMEHDTFQVVSWKIVHMLDRDRCQNPKLLSVTEQWSYQHNADENVVFPEV